MKNIYLYSTNFRVMVIQTLQAVPVADLAQVFNTAFSDYLFPFHLSEADLQAKIKTENIVLEYSVGAFADGKLVGFMLIGIDPFKGKTIAYNAGTGVIPPFRGQQLTERMYSFLFPHLAQLHITQHQLEVLTENHRALAVYQKMGFETARTLNCFKGLVRATDLACEMKKINFPENAKTFWNHEPAYQNSSYCMQRSLDEHLILGAFANDTLIGYIAFVPKTGRIKQLGVLPDFRRNGTGHSLFYKAQQMIEAPTLSAINVDADDLETVVFLQKIGLALTVQQFEMTKEI